ncbi:hypothetical protein [Acinetobacter geminorum]
MINSIKLSISALIAVVLAFYILFAFELLGFDLKAFVLSMM